MPFSDDEYRGIRDHLDRTLLDADLARVRESADSAARERYADRESLKEATVEYIRAVAGELRKRSRRTYEHALEIATEFVQTEDGGGITGFTLVASPNDRTYLGFEEIDLGEVPDMSELARTLEEIAIDLESD